MNELLTRQERDVLISLQENPKTFAQIQYNLCEGDDLRTSTVSGLIAGLVKCELITNPADGQYAITLAGRRAVAQANPTVVTLAQRAGRVRKARPGDGQVFREQGLQREYIFTRSMVNAPVSLERVTLYQGEECTPHAHIDTETIVYTLRGRVRVYSGAELSDVIDVGVDDCVYIPPNEQHYVINLWAEPMVAVVARFNPTSRVVEYPLLRRPVVSLSTNDTHKEGVLA